MKAAQVQAIQDPKPQNPKPLNLVRILPVASKDLLGHPLSPGTPNLDILLTLEIGFGFRVQRG